MPVRDLRGLSKVSHRPVCSLSTDMASLLAVSVSSAYLHPTEGFRYLSRWRRGEHCGTPIRIHRHWNPKPPSAMATAI